MNKIHDIGVATKIGPYSDAIEVEAGSRWLYTAGTPGMDETGTLPSGIEGQARLVWKHMLSILAKAGMTTHDLVKVSTSLVDPADKATYVKVRSEILGEVRPAFMLSIVSELIRPDVLVEVEIVAAAK